MTESDRGKIERQYRRAAPYVGAGEVPNRSVIRFLAWLEGRGKTGWELAPAGTVALLTEIIDGYWHHVEAAVLDDNIPADSPDQPECKHLADKVLERARVIVAQAEGREYPAKDKG